jgi:retinol dehydrogenase-12
MSARYPETKLLNVQFARGLTARLPPLASVVVNSVNPGFCYSDIGRNNKNAGSRAFMKVMHFLLARSTEVGSRTLVWAALAGLDDPTFNESLRGAYTENCKIGEPSDFLFSKEGKLVEQRIWVCIILHI